MTLLSLLATILIGISTLALLSGIYVLRSMFIPTRGKRIASYPAPTKALLVLDIQESGEPGKITRPSPPPSTPFGTMIASVNHLIEYFDRTGLQVAYIRQVFSNNIVTRLHGGRILAGRMEPRICRWINVINNNDFAKNRTDAFSNRQLEQFLIDHQVAEVVLVGLDAAFCVYYTALGALQRGYRVTVVTDAIMSGRDMGKALERFQRKGVRLISSSDLIKHTSTSLQVDPQIFP